MLSAKSGCIEKQLREVVAACFIFHGSPKGAKLRTSQLATHAVWEETHFNSHHITGNHSSPRAEGSRDHALGAATLG